MFLYLVPKQIAIRNYKTVNYIILFETHSILESFCTALICSYAFFYETYLLHSCVVFQCSFLNSSETAFLYKNYELVQFRVYFQSAALMSALMQLVTQTCSDSRNLNFSLSYQILISIEVCRKS